MSGGSCKDVATLLLDWGKGDAGALDQSGSSADSAQIL
jgi:hypothetical protein